MSAQTEAAQAHLRRASRKNRFTSTPVGQWSIRVGMLVFVLLLWEFTAKDINRALTAPPSEIFVAAWDQLFVTGVVWGPLLTSLLLLVAGLATALAIGLPIGIAMGRWKPVAFALDPYVTFLYSLPHVALVPLMIIVLGFDWQFRYAYVVLSAVWPVIINTMAGVRAVDKALIDAGVAYTANERQIIRGIVLPAASPFMVAGGRQAFAEAWSGVIVAEITSTLVGVGGMIELFAIEYLTAQMFVPIFIIMIIAVAIQGLAAWAQQKLTPWQPGRGAFE
ncbi:ABC transporter permease [Agromyces sp. SYSU T00194]|uniref:ABC transporter permease n=1 Tax=Agromyces chitinivorans TaxID=3158560 RepID=UPI003392A372